MTNPDPKLEIVIKYKELSELYNYFKNSFRSSFLYPNIGEKISKYLYREMRELEEEIDK